MHAQRPSVEHLLNICGRPPGRLKRIRNFIDVDIHFGSIVRGSCKIIDILPKWAHLGTKMAHPEAKL
eukprot:10789252-Karenia_brevis.AAC.1